MKPGVPRAHARANVILISLLPSSSSYCGNASVLGRVSILRHHFRAVYSGFPILFCPRYPFCIRAKSSQGPGGHCGSSFFVFSSYFYIPGCMETLSNSLRPFRVLIAFPSHSEGPYESGLHAPRVTFEKKSHFGLHY